ncbi:MAG TPA: hypothetical protein P5205_19655 [Candidatus Paceibacterota bacterium]|nr:hypothetical protein [Verrucomicrobiota bacterium]HSA12582.1 hypothetical protein [Candidatus Paceibacterota bacterium]
MNSRAKGVRGERQWRDELRANGYAARRGQQFSGSPDSPDVICDGLPWAHFEVKLAERLDIYAAMDQARRDCGGRAAFVAHRRNFWPWLVSMDAERFYRLLRVDVTGDWAERMGGGSPAPVFAGLPWAFCQVREGSRLNIHEAMAQAKRSAGGRVALLAHRRPGGRWVVTMTGEAFFEFLRGTLPPERTGAERQELNKDKAQER